MHVSCSVCASTVCTLSPEWGGAHPVADCSAQEPSQVSLWAQVSGNHRLDSNKAERARAEAAGAEIAASVLEGKPVGPLRVWPGGLAMSRSLGDHPVRAAQGVG